MLRLRVPWIELERRREEFLRSRSEVNVTDDSFNATVADDLGADERRVVPVLRRALARNCGVPAEKIRANDTAGELEPLMGAGGFVGWFLGVPYGFHCDSYVTSLLIELKKEFGRVVTVHPEVTRTLSQFSCDEHGRSTGCKFVGEWVLAGTRAVLKDLRERGV